MIFCNAVFAWTPQTKLDSPGLCWNRSKITNNEVCKPEQLLQWSSLFITTFFVHNMFCANSTQHILQRAIVYTLYAHVRAWADEIEMMMVIVIMLRHTVLAFRWCRVTEKEWK